MKFNEQLNLYLDRLDCSAGALAAAAGLSPAAVSRYRSGERVPDRDGDQLLKLARGISSLAAEKGLTGLTEAAVLAQLQAASGLSDEDFDRVGANLKDLLAALDIRLAELARALRFDASYLSRICSGQRRPVRPEEFIDRTCRFIVRHCADRPDALTKLLGGEAASETEEALARRLAGWLCADHRRSSDSLSGFLSHLDAFDLNEYIRAIHFDEIRVPTVPLPAPAARNYYGLEEMKRGELDFFKATVLSRSAEPVFMCSDMPMADMAQDVGFGKKWMYGLAVLLKKGLHLNIIHNLDRPFDEMMLGLESWIPLYMTGQVSPYYLKGQPNRIYGHLNYVSGSAALAGECVEGFHGEGKYRLSRSREDVAYYRKKAERLLRKAQPLMDIYRQDAKPLLHAFLLSDSRTAGARRGILSAPPLYTMPDALFSAIVRRGGVSAPEADALLAHLSQTRELAEHILRENTILDELPELTREEFQSAPPSLPLAGAFYEKALYYTYDDYQAHIQATRRFETEHANYAAIVRPRPVFRNLQIRIHEGSWVMISKSTAPAIHFVIRHAKMLSAFENLVLPVVEP